eukprot:2564991-Pyramimonas_sp.AAC.1
MYGAEQRVCVPDPHRARAAPLPAKSTPLSCTLAPYRPRRLPCRLLWPLPSTLLAPGMTATAAAATAAAAAAATAPATSAGSPGTSRATAPKAAT